MWRVGRFALGVLFLLYVAGSCADSSEADLPPVREPMAAETGTGSSLADWLESIVVVQSREAPGGCTGALIRRGDQLFVITNAHCVFVGSKSDGQLRPKLRVGLPSLTSIAYDDIAWGRDWAHLSLDVVSAPGGAQVDVAAIRLPVDAIPPGGHARARPASLIDTACAELGGEAFIATRIRADQRNPKSDASLVVRHASIMSDPSPTAQIGVPPESEDYVRSKRAFLLSTSMLPGNSGSPIVAKCNQDSSYRLVGVLADSRDYLDADLWPEQDEQGETILRLRSNAIYVSGVAYSSAFALEAINDLTGH